MQRTDPSFSLNEKRNVKFEYSSLNEALHKWVVAFTVCFFGRQPIEEIILFPYL